MIHSLRNTFITGLDRGGVPREAIERIDGHKSQSMTAHYSDGPEWRQLCAYVEQLSLEPEVFAAAKRLVSLHEGNAPKGTPMRGLGSVAAAGKSAA